MRDEFPIIEKTGTECKLMYFNLKTKLSFTQSASKEFYAKLTQEIELNQLIYILRNRNFQILIKANLIENCLQDFITIENRPKLLKFLKIMCLIEDGTIFNFKQKYHTKAQIVLLSLLCRKTQQIEGADHIILKYAPFGMYSESPNYYSLDNFILSTVQNKIKNNETNLEQYLNLFIQILKKPRNIKSEFFSNFILKFMTFDVEKILPTLIDLLRSDEKNIAQNTLRCLSIFRPVLFEEVSRNLSNLHPIDVIKYFLRCTAHSDENTEIAKNYIFKTWKEFGKMIPRELQSNIFELDPRRTALQILDCNPMSFFYMEKQFSPHQAIRAFNLLETYSKSLEISENDQFFAKLEDILQTIHLNSSGKNARSILTVELSVISWIIPKYPSINELKVLIEDSLSQAGDLNPFYQPRKLDN